MKKTIIGIIVGVLVCLGVMLIRSLGSTTENIQHKTAFITINNESDFKINNVILTHGFGQLSVSDIGLEGQLT